MNAKSPLLIGVRRSKKAFPEDSAFVNQHRFQATTKFKLQNHFFVCLLSLGPWSYKK